MTAFFSCSAAQMHVANEKGSGKRSIFIKIMFQEPFCFTNLRKITLVAGSQRCKLLELWSLMK